MTYDRFFAFGCSFTSWAWPTWADIIGRQFDDRYRNHGLCAAGNEYIINRLVETHARHRFTARDLVIVCWTNFAREDRYRDNQWITAGNIFTQQIYPQSWVRQWFDLKGALIKTSTALVSATHLLQDTACTYMFTSALPMQQVDQYSDGVIDDDLQSVISVYQDYYDLIQPSMAQHLWQGWKNPSPVRLRNDWDNHPDPVQHLKYVTDIISPVIKIDISPDSHEWVHDWQSQITQDPRGFETESTEYSFASRVARWHNELF